MDRTAEHVYTPAELNQEVRLRLEAGFPRVLVEAEISNLARPASGHLYFSLKDDRAQIRCALFRSAAARVKVPVENGRHVLARGRISLYEPRGDYQFIIDGMEDAGEGILQRRFEELKKKLEAEGLFAPEHKQAIPAFPARIGLVTSASGAAVRDLVQVLARRWPTAEVRLYPVPVQGQEAPEKISWAITAANRQEWADTLIVGRGGGSLEDLAAFNDEALARTIFSSSIPVISAVGHETDFSISDFVADLRAPTPSAAAELATPDESVLKASYARFQRQLAMRQSSRLQSLVQRVDHTAHRLQQRHPAAELARRMERLSLQRAALLRAARWRLAGDSARLQALSGRLYTYRPDRILAGLAERLRAAERSISQSVRGAIHRRQERLAGLARTMHAVSPLETIGRGYSIITVMDTGKTVSSVDQVAPGDRIQARIRDGRLDCTVDQRKKQ